MKIKIILFIGWFGVLTPVYGAGVVTALFIFGEPDLGFVGRIVLVSVVNYFIGRRVLGKIATETTKTKAGNKYASVATRS